MWLFTTALCLILLTDFTLTQKGSKRNTSRYPLCSPEVIDSENIVVNYVFLLDHAHTDDKIDKLKYLMKAMSCEIGSTNSYKLRLLHASHEQSKPTKVVNSSDFPRLLDDNEIKDKKNKKTSLCDRLNISLPQIRTHPNQYYRFIVPYDFSKETCSVIDTFRTIFGNFKHRKQIYLDIIGFNKGSSSNNAIVVSTQWNSIDVKVPKLTVSSEFRDISGDDHITAQITNWAHRTIDTEDQNVVFENWTLPTKSSISETTSIPISEESEVLNNTQITTVSDYDKALNDTDSSTLVPTDKYNSNSLVKELHANGNDLMKMFYNKTVYEIKMDDKESALFKLMVKNNTKFEFIKNESFMVFEQDFRVENIDTTNEDGPDGFIRYKLNNQDGIKFFIDIPTIVHKNHRDMLDDSVSSTSTILETYLANLTDTVSTSTLQMDNITTTPAEENTDAEEAASVANGIFSISMLSYVYFHRNVTTTSQGISEKTSRNEQEQVSSSSMKTPIIILAIFFILLTCCLCYIRRKNKREYHISDPASTPLIKVSSKEATTPTTVPGTALELESIEVKKTSEIPSQNKRGSSLGMAPTQRGSLSSTLKDSDPDPYSPPINYVADLQYDDIQVTPPFSPDILASKRNEVKPAQELKSLRIAS